ncbi:MAG TPA: hypothetical protein VFS23_40950 [Vicinamibacterales bacterium]|nr:hypothetical protein [Vicinamibacterales bacterium]
MSDVKIDVIPPEAGRFPKPQSARASQASAAERGPVHGGVNRSSDL